MKLIEYIKEDKYLVVILENNQEALGVLKSELGGYRHNFEFKLRFELGIIHNIKLLEDDNNIYLYFKTLPKYHEECIKEFDSYFELKYN